MTNRHLVLGGTRGIGLAYAEHHAKAGNSLELVGRTEADLKAAAFRLRELGAPVVDTCRGDLVDEGFREKLISRRKPDAFVGIFLGGPSPPPGHLGTFGPGEIREAAEVCVSYPLSVFEWLVGADWKGLLTVLSSSATQEEVCPNEFFLSGLFRRPLERILACYRGQGLEARVWRPKVVLTSLSRRYARGLPEFEEDDDPRATLRKHFGVEEVPTASEFVTRHLA